MKSSLVIFFCVVVLFTKVSSTKNVGNVNAVYELIDRVLGEHVTVFDLEIDSSLCGEDDFCFEMSSLENDKIRIVGTTASEVSYGVGYYLREYCNMTVGWKRGGGSRIEIPNEWPSVDDELRRNRNTRYSYIMNVCTHSYSLVWYGWEEWENFIDWMSLSGINLFLALTGQEEVQYKVFQSYGLSDMEIRSWFNGPAFLTWSRGQNEYGNNIAGPLPRSFMKNQWNLQRQILNRTRSLGIIGQLPGFQGNVPVQLIERSQDSNITAAAGTGWMNSVDPLYANISDTWMKTLINDFGTDHWYQLDGYFNGGTAPWLQDNDDGIHGSDKDDDMSWFMRGKSAYESLNRTDPDAVWSYQGWAFVGWNSETQAQEIKSFVDATPPGKFNIIDMSVNGDGEWKKTNFSNFWDAKIIWTTLSNFGGTDGMRGDLERINTIPFDGPANVWGTGFSPEGIDTNPVYFNFMLETNWRDNPVKNVTEYVILERHKRYGFSDLDTNVAQAWTELVNSTYAQDLSVQDGTGVAHVGAAESWAFEDDRFTPTSKLCQVHRGWKYLTAAAAAASEVYEPLRYDVVNVGREVLAQLVGPFGQNFSDAMNAAKDPNLIHSTSSAYVSVLNDLDRLVATDQAFLLGSWIEMARDMASGGEEDCTDTGYETINSCRDFYEWNARVQLTTWNPTPKDAAKVPKGPIDYASKHWNGLIRDYYAERVVRYASQAVEDALASRPLNQTAISEIAAKLAYKWTTSTSNYPKVPVENAVHVATEMQKKYAYVFDVCY